MNLYKIINELFNIDLCNLRNKERKYIYNYDNYKIICIVYPDQELNKIKLIVNDMLDSFIEIINEIILDKTFYLEIEFNNNDWIVKYYKYLYDDKFYYICKVYKDNLKIINYNNLNNIINEHLSLLNNIKNITINKNININFTTYYGLKDKYSLYDNDLYLNCYYYNLNNQKIILENCNKDNIIQLLLSLNDIKDKEIKINYNNKIPLSNIIDL